MNGPDEQNLLDYLYVLLRWRRFIVVCAIVVGLGSAGVSLILPEAWTASTTLLPPEDDGPNQLGLSLLMGSGVPAGLAGLVGLSTPSERLLTLLESRRVLGHMVDQFGLVEEYDVPHRDHAIELLAENVEHELGSDGSLSIEVTAGGAARSAELANAVAAVLDSVNREYRQRQARSLREFLTDRLSITRGELVERAGSLQAFQERHGLVDLESQAAASVDVIKGIVQELTLIEVELAWKSRQLSEEHAERRLLKLQVEELRRQLQIAVGEAAEGAAREVTDQSTLDRRTAMSSLGPPLRALPGLIAEHTELTLELAVREEILQYLGARLEEAKYREALDTPTLQVLDVATPPQTRSAPRRGLLVLACVAASLALSSVLAFLLESWTRMSTQNEARIAAIRDLFR